MKFKNLVLKSLFLDYLGGSVGKKEVLDYELIYLVYEYDWYRF